MLPAVAKATGLGIKSSKAAKVPTTTIAFDWSKPQAIQDHSCADESDNPSEDECNVPVVIVPHRKALMWWKDDDEEDLRVESVKSEPSLGDRPKVAAANKPSPTTTSAKIGSREAPSKLNTERADDQQEKSNGPLTPSDLDVILPDRTFAILRRPGNIRYSELLAEVKRAFDEKKDLELRATMCWGVYTKVKDWGGRFLELTDDGEYKEMAREDVRAKISRSVFDRKFSRPVYSDKYNMDKDKPVRKKRKTKASGDKKQVSQPIPKKAKPARARAVKQGPKSPGRENLQPRTKLMETEIVSARPSIPKTSVTVTATVSASITAMAVQRAQERGKLEACLSTFLPALSTLMSHESVKLVPGLSDVLHQAHNLVSECLTSQAGEATKQSLCNHTEAATSTTQLAPANVEMKRPGTLLHQQVMIKPTVQQQQRFQLSALVGQALSQHPAPRMSHMPQVVHHHHYHRGVGPGVVGVPLVHHGVVSADRRLLVNRNLITRQQLHQQQHQHQLQQHHLQAAPSRNQVSQVLQADSRPSQK